MVTTMMYTTMEEVYRWEIKDISSEFVPGGCYVAESQKFSFGADGLDSNAFLRLGYWKKRPDLKDRRCLQIDLVKSPAGSHQQTVIDKEKLHLRVEKADCSSVVIQGSPGSRLSYGNGDIGYLWIDTLEFGKDESFDAEDFFSGSLIITLMLKKKSATASIAKKPHTAATSDICVKKIKKGKFEEMIAKLENDEKNSDVKIISADGQEFYAYRWILSEVSDVFEAMFRSDMMEKETGVVKFEDLSGATVKLLLHFIYTQNIGQEWSTPEIIEEFVCAADKYQIQDLKEFLDANLGKACTAENAGNLFILAEKTSMKKSVADILAFVKEQCNDPKGFLDILKNTKSTK